MVAPILGRKGAIKVQPQAIDSLYVPIAKEYLDPAVECAYITDWDLRISKETMDNTPINTSLSNKVVVNGKEQVFYQTHYDWSDVIAIGLSWSGSASCYYTVSNSDASKYAQRLLQNCIVSTNSDTSKAELELYVNYVPVGDVAVVRKYVGIAMITELSVSASSDAVVKFDIQFEGCGILRYLEA